jgi:hypothetical protein
VCYLATAAVPTGPSSAAQNPLTFEVVDVAADVTVVSARMLQLTAQSYAAPSTFTFLQIFVIRAPEEK